MTEQSRNKWGKRDMIARDNFYGLGHPPAIDCDISSLILFETAHS
jgi:hypothetical protein